jgi:hypothetical protein
MFASVLVALAGRADSRDALVLGTQLAPADGRVLVAHVMATSATPLTGGTAAAASRRASLRDAGEEVYATLGPDPRVRFLAMSGLPFAEAVTALAGREHADVIAVAQSLLGQDPGARQLLARAPCPVTIAPYGQRFLRAFAPVRITVVCGPPGHGDDAVRVAATLAERIGADVRLIAADDQAADAWLERARALAPTAAATRVAGRGPAALLAQTRAEDLLVVGVADAELLRQAACPVLVAPAAAHVAHHAAA